MKKHEEDCEHRLIPCAFCSDKIGMQGLAEHLQKKHGRKPFTYKLSEVISLSIGKDCIKTQTVLIPEGGIENQQFASNMLTLDGGAKMWWLSYLGPIASAKTLKYTLRLKARKDSEEYLRECTNRCESCDLSHEEAKREMCGVIVPQKLIEEAAEGDEDNRFYYEITIQKA